MKTAPDVWKRKKSEAVADCRVFQVRRDFSERESDGAEEIVLELPGGMIDENEKPEIAGRRELLEETGFSSNDFIYLGKSRPNPAWQNNWIYHFLALNCKKSDATSFDEHESIITKLVPVAEIESLIKNGEFTHSLAVAAFYYFNLYKKL